MTDRCDLPEALERSDVLFLVRLDESGAVLAANKAVRDALQLDGRAIAGVDIRTLLTEADAESLARRLAGRPNGADGWFLLNFVGSAQSPVTMRCRLESDGAGTVLIAEPLLQQQHGFERELLRLNNELAVLSRERARQGRQLAEALDALRIAQAALVHREKMASLGQMTAGVAHEINNPLAYVLSNHATIARDLSDIRAYIDSVRLAVQGPDAHRELRDWLEQRAFELDLDATLEALPAKLEANLDGLSRVRDIVADLRTFSRLDESGFKACDLGDSLRATMRFLGPLAAEHGVNLVCDCAPCAPLVCAPGPLNQAVANIVANAIQASPRGGQVGLSMRGLDTDIEISVEDAGPGIAPEHLARVFDPFFTTKPVGSGTGLGLSIAHQVVAAHGGRILIDSEPGRGTIVRVVIPVSGRVSHPSQA